MYLVMEYCPGGELFDIIADKGEKEGVFNESEAAQIMKKLFQAINHCHANNISHRDIKPENIMIGEDGEVKLIDFGLSKKSKKSSMDTVVGTPYYVAPEVLSGTYSNECDLWSLGVLLYILLSGYLPFGGDNAQEVFKKILKGQPNYEKKEWKKVSDEGISLVKQLLEVDPKKRLNAANALKHLWFSMNLKIEKGSEADKLDGNVVGLLKSFKGSSKLKKAAMNVLVKQLSNKEIDHLRVEFQKIDTGNTGFIDANELANAMQDLNRSMTRKEIEKIIKEVDYAGNGQINYSEFLAATVSVKSILTEDRMFMLFKQFDVDDTNYITFDNIKDAFIKLGKKLTNEEVK